MRKWTSLVIRESLPISTHDDDAAPLIRGASGIVILATQLSCLPRRTQSPPSSAHQAHTVGLQNFAFLHREDLLEFITLAEGEYPGGTKAAVQAYTQPRTREGRSQPRKQPRQDPDHTDPGAGISGAQ